MARARSRPQRTLLLLIAMLLLLMLLELDQWLPGAGRGGSGGGFRAVGEAGLVDPRAPAPEAEPPSDAPEDPTTVVPPTAPPRDWPPRDGLVIEVRGPDGEAAMGWRLGTGDGGPEDGAPDDGGRTLRRDRRVTDEGIRVRTGGRVVRHRFGTAEPASHWVVHLPQGQPPEQRQPQPVTLEVRDADTGEPLPDVQADWMEAMGGRTRHTDAQGRVTIDSEGHAVPVELRRRGHETTRAYVRPRDPRPQVAALRPLRTVKATFRWPDGTPARFSRVEPVAGDGTPLLPLPGPGADTIVGPEVELELPVAALAEGRLRLRPVRGSEEGLRLDLPLAGLEGAQTLPEVRTVRVLVRDAEGRPLDRAQVLVQPEPGESGGDVPRPWRVMTNMQGEARVAMPAGQGLSLLVTKGDLGPTGRTLGALDGGDGVELVLRQGVQVPVRVVGPGGRPLEGATCAARGVSEGVRVELGTSYRTDADGRTSIGPLPEGEVEVYATAPGHAWGATVVPARPAMGTVTLQLEPAARLRLVVSDAFGVPLEGVRVDVTVASGGAPLASPPGAHADRTDDQGRIVLEDLPPRRYDVTLTAPDRARRVLRGVEPGEAVHFVTLLER